jgi:hypothetical protein
MSHKLHKGKGRGKARSFTSNATAHVNDLFSLSKPLSNNQLVHTVQQYLPETTIQSTNGSATFYSGAALTILSPAVSLLDQITTFSAMYDMYRIVRIDWEFRPMFNQTNFAIATDTPPLIYTMLDYDDNVVLPSLAQARQYENMRIHQYEKFDVTCRPTCGIGVSITGGTSSFAAPAVVRSPWLNINNTAALHLGLKVAITQGTASLQKWYVSTRLTVEFQTVR